MINDSLKLCIATQHFFPTHGGAQLRFMRYLPGLIQRGIQPSVFTGTPKEKKKQHSESLGDWERLPHGVLMPATELNGAAVRRVRLPNKGALQRIYVFNRAAVDFCLNSGYRPDIIQFISSLQPPSLFWIRKLRERGLKMVYAYTLSANIPENILLKSFWKFAFHHLYNQFHCIITSSATTAKMIQDLDIRSKIAVIPNGVDLEQFQPPRKPGETEALKKSFGLGPNDLMLTSVGAIHPRKGSDILLESWVSIAQRFPGAHLFLVGLRKDLSYPRLSGFRDKIQELIAKSNAADRVHLPGEVRNVSEYLKASDLFIFPSAREGMPNAVLEAMATGLPVVLTPFLGLSDDFGKSGREYLLVDRNAQAISGAVSSLLSDPSARTRYGATARKWVENTMGIEQALDQYAALYRRIASS